jgi:hypothetical protein
MAKRTVDRNSITKNSCKKKKSAKKKEYEERVKQFQHGERDPCIFRKHSHMSLQIGAKNPYAMISESHLHQKRKEMNTGFSPNNSAVFSTSVDTVFYGIPTNSTRQYIADVLCSPVMLGNEDKPPLDKLKFEHLFDPVYRSQLFCYKRNRRRIVRLNESGATDRLQTQAGSLVDCENLNMSLGQPANVPVAKADNSYLVDDPIQGAAPDCWIIAALSSLAWVYPYPISTCGDFGMIFLGNPDNGDFQDVNIDDTSSMPMNGSQPAGAKSKDSSVTWPAWYEVAMAKFLGIYSGNNPKEICRIPPGDPQFALSCLMFSPYCSDNRVDLKTAVMADYLGNQAIAGKRSPFIVADGNHRGFTWFTQCPTVAWTYCSGDTNYPLPESYANNPTGRATGVTYTDDILVANHSYSVLGICRDPADVEYVVLRNPYGVDSICDNLTYGICRYAAVKLQLVPTAGTLPQSIVYTDADGKTHIYHGIFALKISDFVQYFAGFGWVPC